MIKIANSKPAKLELHCHTNESDGLLTPTQLVEKAISVGITTLAITDHDTVAGITEGAAAAAGRIEYINGIEFGCHMPFGEMHMLGYLFDSDNEELNDRLQWLRDERAKRGERMVEKLDALGLPISWERVREIAGEGSIGRPHVAQAVVEAGYASDTNDAFARYLGWGQPAYVERTALEPLQVIALVKSAGGVVAVAHPGHIPDLEAVLAPLVEAGLAGLECYYGEYDGPTVQRLVALADSLNLIPTGGSDYHGRPIKDHAELGASPTVPTDTIERLRARVQSAK